MPSSNPTGPPTLGPSSSPTVTNIDECAEGTHTCHANADCVDTIESYECTCKEGYSGDGVTSCVNIDECALGVDNCHALADCVDTVGSFECNCMAGYSGDGITSCIPTICDSLPGLVYLINGQIFWVDYDHPVAKAGRLFDTAQDGSGALFSASCQDTDTITFEYISVHKSKGTQTYTGLYLGVGDQSADFTSYSAVAVDLQDEEPSRFVFRIQPPLSRDCPDTASFPIPPYSFESLYQQDLFLLVDGTTGELKFTGLPLIDSNNCDVTLGASWMVVPESDIGTTSWY